MSYLRFPHIHGDQIVFVADDDLWLTDVAGGRATRLTVDAIEPRSPRFSPDGTKIAYASGAGKHNDAFVLDLDGEQRQLTYFGARRLNIAGWLDDERILLISDHADGSRAITSPYALNLDGTVERLPWGPAGYAGLNTDGRAVVMSPNHRGPEFWKRYRGGMVQRLWTSDAKRKKWTRLLPDETASLSNPFWYDGRLCFSSDRGAQLDKNPGEQAQLWSVKPDGKDLRQHTKHSFQEGYVRDASSDGQRIVYHARGELYVMDSLSAKPRRLEISTGLGAPAPMDLVPTERLGSLAPDHGGDGSVLDWRGSAWYLTHRGGPARLLSGKPGVRIREPQVLGSSGRGIWASDVDGEDCLEIAQLDGDGEPRRIARGKLGRILAIQSNHDGSTVATVSHDGRISTVDVAKGSVKTIGTSRNGEATGLVFSPDGRYLVWRDAIADEGMLGRIVGYDLEEQQPFELTRGQFNDFSPAFSLDGKYLYLLSSRTIDPTYDELGFDLNFTHTVRPWVIALRAEDQVPFGPAADGWAISEDADDKKDDAANDKPESVVIDLTGVEDRMVPLPVNSGRYVDLMTTANGVIWRRPNDYTGVLGTGKEGTDEQKDTIEFYDMSRRKLSVVVEGCDGAAVSGDGKQLLVRSGDETWVQSPESKPEDDDKISVDLTRLRRRINPRDEWRQMFDENARLMRDHYYREDMNGLDWAGICAAYRPLIDRITTHDELIDILDETVAELNTSHAYILPPEQGGDAAQGWLGAEYGRNAKGEVTIKRILPGESSDPGARSPLRAAGVAAQVGDVIAAVDGQSTADVAHIGALLQGSAGKVVELTLVRKRMKRRVAVVPIASEAPLHYHEWVARSAAYVEEKSGGHIGYIHVPDMAAYGWAEFQRLIGEASTKEAVIADVRFNGGGHTSPLVIERLARRVVGWGKARHFEDAFPYPHQGMRGPVVFVTNPYAGSDGDIVTAAAQNLGIGPVIGERSWGGVVGIDGRFQLVDGTDVTQPRYAHYFNSYGWGQENYGTDPDIVVEMGPLDWESDSDIQLDAAIAEAMRRLDDTPAAVAPDYDPPQFG